jgi:hypothetical protein
MSLKIRGGRNVSKSISEIIDYVENPDKTDNGRLISSYECDSRIADEQFILSKREYERVGREQGRRNILAYHIRQSFKPGEVSPEDANEIGRRLALSFTRGNHAFVVCTHIDRHHIHNHIIFNSTTRDCTRKFKNFWGSSKAVRRISDILCAEHGLSIIENPKPSRGDYGTWQGDGKPPTYQEQMRRAIDNALAQNPADFDAFLKLMEAAKIECARRGKKWRYRVPDQQRFGEFDALKGDHTEQAIRERIAGTWVIAASGGNAVEPVPENRFKLLIDIQEKMMQGKGAGYAHWARSFNLHEASKTLIFLQEIGVGSYEELEERAAAASADFKSRNAKIKAAEKRMDEIQALQKHIAVYSRTKEVYKQYKAAGYSAKFRTEHDEAIRDHKAAKAYFDSLGLQKLPTIAALKQEYAALLAERRTQYNGYQESKEMMKKMLLAKDNTDRILGISGKAAKTQKREAKPASRNRDI